MEYLVLYWVMLTGTVMSAEPKLHLPIGHETYTLNAFHSAMSETYFGAYADPEGGTGAPFLDLFPNGRFAIVGVSDVGPNHLQALGRYKVNGDRLSLHFSKVRSDQEQLKQQFSGLHLLWGWIVKKDYVTGFEAFIFTAPEWQRLQRDPKQTSYLQRRTPYYDWQATLHSYDADSGWVYSRPH